MAGNIGEYHFDCPLDNLLFGWKKIKGDEFKAEVAKGKNDEEMAQWVDTHGTARTEEEKAAWGEQMLALNYHDDPEKRDWYDEQLKPLRLDPATTPLFDWLEKDDAVSYEKAA